MATMMKADNQKTGETVEIPVCPEIDLMTCDNCNRVHGLMFNDEGVPVAGFAMTPDEARMIAARMLDLAGGKGTN